jgi:hypothetical protein
LVDNQIPERKSLFEERWNDKIIRIIEQSLQQQTRPDWALRPTISWSSQWMLLLRLNETDLVLIKTKAFNKLLKEIDACMAKRFDKCEMRSAILNATDVCPILFHNYRYFP